MQYLNVNLLPFSKLYAQDIAIFLSQPFRIFGTLAIAESQDRDQTEKSDGLSLEMQHSAMHRSRPAKMETDNLTSVLSLYSNLPRASYRMIKVVVLNMILEKAVLLVDSKSNNYFRNSSKKALAYRFITAILGSFLIAPLRLLATELSVFRRFDWRFLQMNSKILPIFFPNLLFTLAQIALTSILGSIQDQCSRSFTFPFSGWYVVVRRTGLKSLGLAAAAIVFLCLYLMIDIIRVRTDLLVLNSEHGIVHVDESFEGGLAMAATSNKHYTIGDTVRRYTRISLLPQAIVFSLLGCYNTLAAEVLSKWFPELSKHGIPSMAVR